MNTLIIIAHGSRRQESNQEVSVLAKKVATLAGGKYDLIAHAYLEMVSPSLPEAIKQCIKKETKTITVFPYFLNSGNHVTRDIPAMVDKAKEKYPDCEFKISTCIGMIDEMPQLILRQALNV